MASGNFANTPRKFAEAIVATSGPSNVIVMLGTIDGSLPESDLQIPDLKKYHQFDFVDDGMIARYVPGIGEGVLIDLEGHKLDVQTTFKYEIINPKNQMKDHLPIKRTATEFIENGTVTVEPTLAYEEQKTEGVVMTQAGALWTCTKNPHCTLKYIRKSNLKKHEDKPDSCKIRMVHPTRKDFLITLNVNDNGLPSGNKDVLSTREGQKIISELQKPPPIQARDDLPMESTLLTDKDTPLLEQYHLGYCLPKPTQNPIITNEVKAYVLCLFKKGMDDITKKVKPADAALRIQDAVNDDGSPMFLPSSWLTEKQVR